MFPDGPFVAGGGQGGELLHGDVAITARNHNLGAIETDGQFHGGKNLIWHKRDGENVGGSEMRRIGLT